MRDAEQTVIHSTANVEAGVQLGTGVRIGPFCHVGANVELGDAVELVSHAVVAGRTKVGARTRIYPCASVGHPPQDLKYAGEIHRFGYRFLGRPEALDDPLLGFHSLKALRRWHRHVPHGTSR